MSSLAELSFSHYSNPHSMPTQKTHMRATTSSGLPSHTVAVICALSLLFEVLNNMANTLVAMMFALWLPSPDVWISWGLHVGHLNQHKCKGYGKGKSGKGWMGAVKSSCRQFRRFPIGSFVPFPC